MSDRIFIEDIRAVGHCVKGIRGWFESNNLDFRAFLNDGIDQETFLATDDAMAQHVVDKKLEREAANG